jgi:putative ABC transport system ATP-binding protein
MNLSKLLDLRKNVERLFCYPVCITGRCDTDFSFGGTRMTILRTTELKKHYGSGEMAVRALDGVDLSVENGEFVAIVGTSGSGKSTLLHMLGGLDRPTSGSVSVDGKEIFSLKDEELTIFRRRKIGFVFQSFNLVPVLNVYENIVLPIQLDGNEPDEGHVTQIVQTLGLESKLQNPQLFLPTSRQAIWTVKRVRT